MARDPVLTTRAGRVTSDRDNGLDLVAPDPFLFKCVCVCVCVCVCLCVFKKVYGLKHGP